MKKVSGSALQHSGYCAALVKQKSRVRIPEGPSFFEIFSLLDTAFIVLRKQKLIFLHWYHHATVLVYCWYSFRDRLSGCMWYVTMNYSVHAIMYGYYFCRVMRIPVSRKVNVLITSLQILQMIFGVIIQVLVFIWRRDEMCPIHLRNIIVAGLMYGSYFILFAKFFINAYGGNRRKIKAG